MVISLRTIRPFPVPWSQTYYLTCLTYTHCGRCACLVCIPSVENDQRRGDPHAHRRWRQGGLSIPAFLGHCGPLLGVRPGGSLEKPSISILPRVSLRVLLAFTTRERGPEQSIRAQRSSIGKSWEHNPNSGRDARCEIRYCIGMCTLRSLRLTCAIKRPGNGVMDNSCPPFPLEHCSLSWESQHHVINKGKSASASSERLIVWRMNGVLVSNGGEPGSHHAGEKETTKTCSQSRSSEAQMIVTGPNRPRGLVEKGRGNKGSTGREGKEWEILPSSRLVWVKFAILPWRTGVRGLRCQAPGAGARGGSPDA